MTISEECWAHGVCGECGEPLHGAHPMPCACCERPLCPRCALALFDAQHDTELDPDAAMPAMCSGCFAEAE